MYQACNTFSKTYFHEVYVNLFAICLSSLVYYAYFMKSVHYSNVKVLCADLARKGFSSEQWMGFIKYAIGNKHETTDLTTPW